MRIHKQILLAVLAAIPFSVSAQPLTFSKWQGVWTGQLDGQPGVILTLVDEDGGQMGGTVVFNMVERVHKDDPPHVAGYSLHMLEHLKPSDNTLNFEVIRRSDHKDLQFKLQVMGDKKAQLTCTNCDSPATEMVRSF
jgi:hypothetical protein